jgi:hypothetical protein
MIVNDEILSVQEHLQPRIVVSSLPQLRTQTIYKTNTLKLIEE